MYGYLMHYGVKGMQWGVRHYQNPDGTLTPEGRRHYDMAGNLVRNSTSGVARFHKMDINGKERYLQNTRFLRRDDNGKLRPENNFDMHLKTKKDVADWYNLQRSSTLNLIKKDAKASVKSGERTRKEANADYKAAKRDVDRVMSKYYGKNISSFAKKDRIAGEIAVGLSAAALVAIPTAAVAVKLLER